MNENGGFTIVELMVAIAVLAVVVSLAAPNFQATVSEARQITLNNKLSSTMRFARSEAIKRSSAVSVCPRQSDITCGTDWSKGMLIFHDSVANGKALQYDGTDETLRAVRLPTSDIKINALARLHGATDAASVSFIRFNSRGQPNWLNGTFVLCDGRGASEARAIVMSGSGIGRRAYSTGSSGGVVVDAGGKAVSC